MFIKKQFESKLQKQTTTTFGVTGNFAEISKRDTNPAKIGSCRLPRMNYERDEQFFAKEDIPIHALEAKNEMKDLVDRNTLGLRKKDWNKSASVARNVADEEDFERKLTRIKMGLLDFPMPKYKEKHIEAGCDTRGFYTGWNVSTEVMNKFERTRLLQTQTDKALSKTQQMFKTLKDYKTPTQSITLQNETLRQKKREEQDIREEMRKKYIFENPAATMERVNAGVHRMVYENQVKSAKPQSEELLLNLTFKPNLTRTLKPIKTIKGYHSGSWGLCPASPEQEVWSCCMSEYRESDGCVRIHVDPKKWNLSSFT